MDEIDVKILKCLKANARENASVIRENVNMSVSAVIERIRKLEGSGMIQKHTTIIDPKRAEKDITAFMFVNLEHPKYNDKFRESVCQNKEVLECHYLAGDYDYLLKIITDSTKSLERLLDSIKSNTGVNLTRTLISLTTVKNEFSVDPDELLKNK